MSEFVRNSERLIVSALSSDGPDGLRRYWDGAGFTSNPLHAEPFSTKKAAADAMSVARAKFGKAAAERAGAGWHLHSFAIEDEIIGYAWKGAEA